MSLLQFDEIFPFSLEKITLKFHFVQGGISANDETDSFEDIDASGASSVVLASASGTGGNQAASSGWIPPPETFKRRPDFATNDDYAGYVRDHIQTGMTVRYGSKRERGKSETLLFSTL